MSATLKTVVPSLGPRAEHDFYVEPSWSADAIFAAERFCGTIFDPACGIGTIVKAAKRAGHQARGEDLIYRGGGQTYTHDFLANDRLMGCYDSIITNPPFALVEPFLHQALKLARFKVAFLLRLSFLEGVGRRWVFEETPLARIHVFESRVSMPPGGSEIEAKGGAVAFMWAVWDHDHQGPPTLHRIKKPKGNSDERPVST